MLPSLEVTYGGIFQNLVYRYIDLFQGVFQGAFHEVPPHEIPSKTDHAQFKGTILGHTSAL